jgi:hypothetical protein
VSGRCYLFHVEYEGTQATVEVDGRGGVLQACGPANVRNAATGWGRRHLQEWGADLSPEPARRRRRAAMERRRLRRRRTSDQGDTQLLLFGI